jgi:IclR family acetate operon transcriptional repressor
MANQAGEASISELAKALGLAPPTIHRIMATLASGGYVRQLPNRRYALGPSLIKLGDKATNLLSTWAMPALQELEAELHETANLAILDANMIVYVAQVPSRHSMRTFTEVGRRVLPHASGVGKAVLSQLLVEQVEAIVRHTGMPRYTPTTLGTEAELIADLTISRSRGYAIDEGEQEMGVRCFAMAVPGISTPTAVSVSGPQARVTLEKAEQFVTTLRAAAERLGRDLSHAGAA